MEVKYQFKPLYKSLEEKRRSDIISYAGKLLEIVGSRTLIVGVNNDDAPFVYEIDGRMIDALDFEMVEY